MKALYHDLMPQIKHLLEVEKATQKDAASTLGVSTKVIERCVRVYGLKTQRTGPRSGKDHFCWKGGRKKVGNYWYVYRPDHPNCTKQRYVAEHRLVMEQKLGRYLLPTEVVHHKDGNPENNDSSNLEVFQTNAEHLKHELKGRIPDWTDDGWLRIQEGVRKAAILKLSKRDDGLQPRTTGHHPSESDSNDEDLAS